MFHIAVLAAYLTFGAQPPQVAVQSPEPTRLADVIVDGRRLRDAVDRFVDDVVAAPVGRGPARWDERVCVGVANMTPEVAQALVDRVSAVAMQAGLEPGEPGCSPNILIVAADDGQMMARALVAARPRVFRPLYAGAARNAGALERFQNMTAAVRWWHVSVPVSQDTGEVAVRLPGQAAPLVRQDGSRLTTRIRNDLRRAFIILDVNLASGISIGQVGDYIGMVALAQVDPEAETSSYDTILNLFQTTSPGLTLTDWDVSFLTALYGSELNQRSANAQGGEISALMIRDRTAASDDAAKEAEDE